MAIEDKNSHVLSPLFSPLIIPGEDGLGSLVPKAFYWMSPAMFILIIPAGFRGTCYYYRKAYYRSFLANPAACVVSTPFGDYNGEKEIVPVPKSPSILHVSSRGISVRSILRCLDGHSIP